MDWTFGIALLVGFAPMFLLMDIVMKNYTYPRVENPFFKDSTFFIMMTVGIFEGVFIFFGTWVLGLLGSPVSIIYMILVAIIELMAMVVVMNLKRFRGKSDSIFYGYGLGLGMAAGIATGFAYVLCMAAQNPDTPLVDPVPVIVQVICLSISLNLMISSCGTNVGEGIARHLPMQFMLQGAIPLAAFNMLMAVVFFTESLLMMFVVLIAMVALGAYYFRKCLFTRLPAIVREVLKMNGIKRDDIPPSKRSRGSVPSESDLNDVTAFQHRGDVLLGVPLAHYLPDIIQGECAFDLGEALGEDEHLLVEVRGVLVLVDHRGVGVGLLYPPFPGLLRARIRAFETRGLAQSLPGGLLVVALEDEDHPVGLLGVAAVGAGGALGLLVHDAGPPACAADEEPESFPQGITCTR